MAGPGPGRARAAGQLPESGECPWCRRSRDVATFSSLILPRWYTRAIVLRNAAVLSDIHRDAMGWEDRHLHEFRLFDEQTQRVISIGLPTDMTAGDRRVTPLAPSQGRLRAFGEPGSYALASWPRS
jgi:hypothetical protein